MHLLRQKQMLFMVFAFFVSDNINLVEILIYTWYNKKRTIRMGNLAKLGYTILKNLAV